jgi:hypothetical protein
MGLTILLACESASGADLLSSDAAGSVSQVFDGTFFPIVNVSTGGGVSSGEPGTYTNRNSQEESEGVGSRWGDEGHETGIVIFDLHF